MNRDKIMSTTQIFGSLSDIMYNCNTLRIPQNLTFAKSKNIQTLSNSLIFLGYFSNKIISGVIYNIRTYTDYSHYYR